MRGRKIRPRKSHVPAAESAGISPVQRKENSTPGSQNIVTSESVSDAITTGMENGKPIERPTASFMESRFGTDFSNVKIHDDAQASDLAQRLNAQAFTVGNDIWFDKGKYSPGTSDGKKLLAHELAHTIQQRTATKSIFKKDEPKTDAEKLGEYIAKNDNAGWGAAYTLLNGMSIVQMLALLNGLTLSDLDNLASHADDAKKASAIGEGGVNRILAAAYAVKSVKDPKMPDADIETAKEKALTIPVDQRIELVTYLSKSKSKAAIKLKEFLQKPLLGYVASGYDYSRRFLRHSGKLGFDIAAGTAGLPSGEWKGDDPEPQDKSITEAAIKAFEVSDLIFFSGHQYAQKGRPGLFTNDTSESCFNMSLISKKLNRVKVVVSTSCATICKAPAKIFSEKFPNAIILGYRLSAPLNGAVLSDAFATELAKKGPLDLSKSADIEKIKAAWRKVAITSGSKEGEPGIIEGENVEFWREKKQKWLTQKWDSKENECAQH